MLSKLGFVMDEPTNELDFAGVADFSNCHVER